MQQILVMSLTTTSSITCRCMHHQQVQYGCWWKGSDPSSNHVLTNIDYVQIMTTGNSVDFGDINGEKNGYYLAMSNGHGGLGIMSDIKINNITDRTGD